MNKQLASLLFYNETLYANPPKEKEDTTEQFATDRHVLVLTENLSKTESLFLEKVLNAVKLSLKDVAILHESIELADLIGVENVKFVLSFGNLVTKNTLTISKYDPALLDGKTFLLSDSVTIINKNEHGEKVKLWNALQAVFLS